MLFSGVQIAIAIQASCASKTLKDFKIKMEEDEEAKKKLAALKSEVEEFALSFPMPGFDDVWSSWADSLRFILWNITKYVISEGFGDVFNILGF